MSFTQAITRLPGENFGQGITTAGLGQPNFGLVLRQHQAYVRALRAVGLTVKVLDPLPKYPDAYFIEDAAVVTPDVAVITRPGAVSRRGEEQQLLPVLGGYREIETIKPPGTLEGGDVLMIGRHFFIGISERTNREGAAQLGRILTRYGCTWTPVPVQAGLHFKSSVSWVGEDNLLVTPAFANREELRGFHQIVLDPEESYAANVLLINGTLLVPEGYPSACEKLALLGYPLVELDTREARKMDGGLSCMSLRF